MADYGVAVTFGDSKPGREKKALDVLAEATTNNDKAVAEGRLDSWDVVIFEASGTPPAGVIRLYGSHEQIEDFVQSEEFLVPFQKASLLVNNVGMRRFVTGAALLEGMSRYTQILDSL
jgi:hypothetical protein